MNIDKEFFFKLVENQYVDPDIFDYRDDFEFKSVSSYDSLTGMAIISVLEDEFECKIPIDKFQKFKTLLELYDFVSSVSNKI